MDFNELHLMKQMKLESFMCCEIPVKKAAIVPSIVPV